MSQNVRAIPEGFHTLTPGLVVKDGHRAIEFPQHEPAFYWLYQRRPFTPELPKRMTLVPLGPGVLPTGRDRQQ